MRLMSIANSEKKDLVPCQSPKVEVDWKTGSMKVHIIKAHPEPTSFNAALAETAAFTVAQLGHTVVTSDLYALNFEAVAGPHDFKLGREDKEVFRLDREQTFAHELGTTSPDIKAEQAKVASADLVIFHYPMWWFMPPGILKGWFDRVFTRGFAYLPGRKYDSGLMHGKTAMVVVTTGTDADTYAPDGIDGALLDVMWPVHNGILRYTGFEVVVPFVVHAPGQKSESDRAAVLCEYADALRRIEGRPRLFFHGAEDYGENERLLPHVEPRSGFQHRIQ